MSDPVVLDASAALAYVKREPGADRVRGVLNGAMISAVNFAEVVGKLVTQGQDGERLGRKLVGLGLAVESFTAADAVEAGTLARQAKPHGLSLADRACLALARRSGRVVLTTDRGIAGLDVGVTVEVIRWPTPR